jgi:hypothetical protein
VLRGTNVGGGCLPGNEFSSAAWDGIADKAAYNVANGVQGDGCHYCCKFGSRAPSAAFYNPESGDLTCFSSERCDAATDYAGTGDPCPLDPRAVRPGHRSVTATQA